MKKAVIAIDSWKLSIFDRHLTQAGYAYGRGLGLTEGTLFLSIETENLQALEVVVRAANAEAARTGHVKE